VASAAGRTRDARRPGHGPAEARPDSRSHQGSEDGLITGSALVLTTSDAAAAGLRPDESGAAIAARLEALGLRVERRVIADEAWEIEAALVEASDRHALIVTSGGTGLTPRDVTPQATAAVIDYEVPGLAEAMRAAGRRSTPMADLSRGIAGVRGRTLIVNVPGSPHASMESLDAIVAVLPHALETLAGPFDHRAAEAAGRSDLPPVGGRAEAASRPEAASPPDAAKAPQS
jgi:molybdenum cofactor synthesis domain-containing protein